jgi:hypothetical protein
LGGISGKIVNHCDGIQDKTGRKPVFIVEMVKNGAVLRTPEGGHLSGIYC